MKYPNYILEVLNIWTQLQQSEETAAGDGRGREGGAETAGQHPGEGEDEAGKSIQKTNLILILQDIP